MGSTPDRKKWGRGNRAAPPDWADLEKALIQRGGGHVNHGMQLNILRAANGRFSTEGHTYIT